MGLAEILTQFWELVTGNPTPFILVATAAAGLGFSAAKTLDRSTIETLRERLGAIKDELDRERNGRRLEDFRESESTVPTGHQVEVVGSLLQEEASSPPPAVEPSRSDETEGDEHDDYDDDEGFIVLEEQEEELLQLLASHGPLHPIELSGLLGISEQKALLYCERIMDASLVSWDEDIGKGRVFLLNRAGREYLDENDLLE